MRLLQVVNFLFTLSAIILFAALKTGSFTLLVTDFIVGGLAYGGVTPTNLAFVSSYYGMKNYSLNFSVVNTNLIFASFGSTIAGDLYDQSQFYLRTYAMIGVLASTCILVSLAINIAD